MRHLKKNGKNAGETMVEVVASIFIFLILMGIMQGAISYSTASLEKNKEIRANTASVLNQLTQTAVSDQKEQNISFSHIFSASGTGSTQCGLVSGKLLEQGTEQIIGLSISSREYDRAIRIMESGISDYFAKNHLVLPEGWESELHLEMGYRQGGYGQYDERILQVIREEFCRNGLPLDPTYTGKAFWGMKQYIEEHQLQDCDVLFIHTGGTPLFYDCILNDTDGGKK